MITTLRHRGPDAAGVWVQAAAGAALAHSRLSILDLSDAGSQPMVSADNRYVLVYNGETYNYAEIRERLQRGRVFRGHSDTEVILRRIEEVGVERTIPELDGMFALAVWDAAERVLWLARDRAGIKPLYWAHFGDLLLFGSELRALRAHPGWPVEINPDAVGALLRYLYIPAPAAIYRGVYKLLPGNILSFRDQRVTVKPYWQARRAAAVGIASRRKLGVAEAEEQLADVLRTAVRRQMVSDVPLGAFLSGGIDSSIVTAFMQANSSRPIKTFCVGFSDPACDEAPMAKRVAQHLGTEHTELYVNAQDALRVIPSLPRIYDEPFADSSAVPTLLLAKLARSGVTVSLSGDGGDELFAGYPRYSDAQRFRMRYMCIPRRLRHIGAGAIRSIKPSAWNSIWRLAPCRPSFPADRMYLLASHLMADDWLDIYRLHVSYWTSAEQVVPGSCDPDTALCDRTISNEIPSMLDRMQYLDFATYLPDDILTKVDRATMAVGLEARVPLLDERVVEFAWGLQRQFKVQRGRTKWLLRRVLHKHVPAELVDRPKRGFSMPLGSWLRADLREWAEDLLSHSSLIETGLLDPVQIRLRWNEHTNGPRNWQDLLWPVLMFQAWQAEWRATPPAPLRDIDTLIVN